MKYKVQEWRQWRGLGSVDLADALGVATTTIDRIERDGDADITHLRAIANVLDVSLETLALPAPDTGRGPLDHMLKQVQTEMAQQTQAVRRSMAGRFVADPEHQERVDAVSAFPTGGPVTMERACNVPPESWPTVMVIRDHTKRHDPADLPDKAPLHLIPADAKALAALALGDGAATYGDFGWQGDGRPVTDHLAAAERHMDQHRAGVTRDAESGLPPLAHAAARILIALALDLRAGDWSANVDGDPADAGPAAGPVDGGAG